MDLIKINSKNRVLFAILQVEAIITTILILIITPRAYETNQAVETVAATKQWISPSISKKPWTPSWNIPPILISSSTHTLSLQTVPRSAHCALILQQLLTTISIATMKILTTFMEIIVKPMIINSFQERKTPIAYIGAMKMDLIKQKHCYWETVVVAPKMLTALICWIIPINKATPQVKMSRRNHSIPPSFISKICFLTLAVFTTTTTLAWIQWIIVIMCRNWTIAKHILHLGSLQKKIQEIYLTPNNKNSNNNCNPLNLLLSRC